MIVPDFRDTLYTAEVLRTSRRSIDLTSLLSDVTVSPRRTESVQEGDSEIAVSHAFVASARPYHRTQRRIYTGEGEVTIPRIRTTRGKDHFAYDVLLLQKDNHAILAVPFHGLAEDFFPRVDRVLAGTRTEYECLNITRIILDLGRKTKTLVSTSAEGEATIGLTRCQLAYADSAGRQRELQSVRLAGSNLGATPEYRYLVEPVLRVSAAADASAQQPTDAPTVTPVLLGFSLFLDGVKHATAVTDQHGNFKIFVAQRLRQLTRLFSLLSVVERMTNVVSTTVNLPIRQARGIRDEGSE